jgi:hypothetical protein
MPRPDERQPLAESRRRAIFLALAEAQDCRTPVDLSRDMVAAWFRLTDQQVRAIQREGLDSGWPPL